MDNFMTVVKVECYKLFISKAFWIVGGLVLILQPVLAMMNARELVHMGLTASLDTHPELVQALPPKEYLGFSDIVPFGLLPMTILGGMIGADNYKNQQLRTTLLCCGNRLKLYSAKVVSFTFCVMIFSSLSIWLTIMSTHFFLKNNGLNPMTLSTITWQFIGYSIIGWTAIVMLAYLFSLISRNLLISFLFFVPQIYGLASYLSSNYQWGKYLPVAAANALTATPTDEFGHDPIQGGCTLCIWLGLSLAVSLWAFVRQDVGGTSS